MKRDPRTGPERVFDLLVRLYPKSFRNAYGEPMRQAFRDQCRNLSREHGALARWRLVLGSLADTAMSVSREHQAVAWKQRGVATPVLLLMTLLLAGATLCFHQRIVQVTSDAFSQVSSIDIESARQRASLQAYAFEYRTAALQRALSHNSVATRLVALAVAQEPFAHRVPADQIESVGASLNSSVDWSLDTDLATLRLVTWGCAATRACDARPGLRRLQREDSDNVATWLLTASLAAQSGDDEARTAALRQALEADSFETPLKAAAATWLQASNLDSFRAPWWAAAAERLSLRSMEYEVGVSAFGSPFSACAQRDLPVRDLAFCKAIAEAWHDRTDVLWLRMGMTHWLALSQGQDLREAMQELWLLRKSQDRQIDAASSSAALAEALAGTGAR